MCTQSNTDERHALSHDMIDEAVDAEGTRDDGTAAGERSSAMQLQSVQDCVNQVGSRVARSRSLLLTKGRRDKKMLLLSCQTTRHTKHDHKTAADGDVDGERRRRRRRRGDQDDRRDSEEEAGKEYQDQNLICIPFPSLAPAYHMMILAEGCAASDDDGGDGDGDGDDDAADADDGSCSGIGSTLAFSLLGTHSHTHSLPKECKTSLLSSSLTSLCLIADQQDPK